MLAAYSKRQRVAARLRKALDGSVSAHVDTEWDTFRERARSAECVCVALPGLDPRETPGGLAGLRSHYPTLPLILLSRKRAEALLISTNPDLTWEEVRSILKQNADDWGDSKKFGAGKLNLDLFYDGGGGGTCTECDILR